MKRQINILQRLKTGAYHFLCAILARKDLGRLVSKAKRIIDHPEITVISFDIFDTCLNRLSYRPEDIFRLAFQHNDPSLIQERCRAERELKRTGIPYPSYKEIWSYLGAKCHLSDQQVQLLSQKEIQMEKHLLSARKPILDLYEYAARSGKRIIAVSDMYLDSHTLRDLLIHAGYHNFDQIYVSCECHGSKSDGSLYDYVLKQEPISSPRHIVHIGNDYMSDCLMARRKRIRHFCIPSPYQRFHYSTMNACQYMTKHFFSVQERCLFGHILNSSEENGGLSFKRSGLSLQLFSKAIVFPILFRIDEFILQSEKVQKNYHEVYFVSRDGWLPMIGYQMMRDYYGRGLPATYLYGSRLLCNKSDNEQKNQRVRMYYQSTIHRKNGRAIIYDIGYNGSVSFISSYFDTKCIIDKIYLWQTSTNKTVDIRFGSTSFVLDDSTTYTPILSFLEPLFIHYKEGSIIDFDIIDNQFVPIYRPVVVKERNKKAVEEVQNLALSLFASYLPFKSFAQIPDLQNVSSFTALVFHYFGGVFRSSSSCLKNITHDDPLALTRSSFSLDRYIKKEAWNQFRIVTSFKSFIFNLIQHLQFK